MKGTAGSIWQSSLVPLVERGDADVGRTAGDGRAEHVVVILSVPAVAGRRTVPRTYAGVDITRSDAGDEHLAVALGPRLHLLPVGGRRTVGEAVAAK